MILISDFWIGPLHLILTHTPEVEGNGSTQMDTSVYILSFFYYRSLSQRWTDRNICSKTQKKIIKMIQESYIFTQTISWNKKSLRRIHKHRREETSQTDIWEIVLLTEKNSSTFKKPNSRRERGGRSLTLVERRSNTNWLVLQWKKPEEAKMMFEGTRLRTQTPYWIVIITGVRYG